MVWQENQFPLAQTTAGPQVWEPECHVHLHLFTQLNFKQGLKKFRGTGVDAILKELQQIHKLRVVKPVTARVLTNQEKSDSLQ